MKKYAFLLLLIFTWCCSFQAAPQLLDSNVFIPQSSVPDTMPVLNSGTFEDLNARYSAPEFDYSETPKKEIIEEKSSTTDLSFIGYIINGLVSYILPLVLAFVVILGGYHLMQYLRQKNTKQLRRSTNDDLISTEHHIEDIHEIDFAKHIQDALNANEYTKAIRWSYLHNLKLMDDKTIIIWEPKKTNRDYYYEIKQAKLRRDFKYLTYIYDYVWFGKFELEETEAQQILSKFENFKLILNKI